jgi:hypothetical protein
LIPEILEFDENFDQMFSLGLKRGIPIKFNSWNTYQYSNMGSSNCRLQVKDASKSIKAMFCLQTYPELITIDSHASVSGSSFVTDSAFLKSYQWKVGNKYFPPAPIKEYFDGTDTNNGGCESFTELQKALKTIGRYNPATAVGVTRWLAQASLSSQVQDYTNDYYGNSENGSLYDNPAVNSFKGSACYCAAIDLETSKGVELSGIDGQINTDICFIGQWNMGQYTNCILTIFVNYDAMIVLRDGNVLELIK